MILWLMASLERRTPAKWLQPQLPEEERQKKRGVKRGGVEMGGQAVSFSAWET